MSLFSQKHFQWTEPKLFLSLMQDRADQARKWWHKPALTAGIAAILMVAQHMGVQARGQQPIPGMIFTAIFLGALMAYGAPWLQQLFPSEIAVFDNCIRRSRGRGHRSFSYDKMTSFSIAPVEGVPAISLNLRGGGEIIVGLPSGFDTAALAEFLSGRGLQEADS